MLEQRGCAPAELTGGVDAVRPAAEAAGATYVDPLTLGWFADPAGLVSPADGISAAGRRPRPTWPAYRPAGGRRAHH